MGTSEPADVAPLDGGALRAAVGAAWARVDVVASTGSTNADLVAVAADAPDRTVLVAEHQHAGRGRLTRRWTSSPGSGLTFSVLLRPTGVPQRRFGWVPLLAGLALVDAVRELTAVRCALKWPNDLMLGPHQRKAAGILAEVATSGPTPAVVLGIGLNIAATPPDQPAATCLLAEQLALQQPEGSERRSPGRPQPPEGSEWRAEVLVAVLGALGERERRWRECGGDPVAAGLWADYRGVCSSVGAGVRVTLPGGGVVDGVAEDVDVDGRLVVRRGDGSRLAVAAGDVVHARAN